MGFKSRLFKYYFPDAVAEATLRRMSKSTGIVLMYHEVLPDDFDLPAWTIVKESNFRWQVQYLKKHFEIVDIDLACKKVSGEYESSKPFAVISFDDGYRGNYSNVLPFMESMGAPFIVYIATQAIIDKDLHWYDHVINLLNTNDDVILSIEKSDEIIDFKIPANAAAEVRWKKVQSVLSLLKKLGRKKRKEIVDNIKDQSNNFKSDLEMMNIEQLKKLSDSNCVVIGSHTHGHDLMDQLDEKALLETISVASHYIEKITGEAPKHFAYPNGNFNKKVVEQVEHAGFKTGVTTKPGLWTGETQLLTIPRLGVGRFTTNEQFKAIVSRFLGLFPFTIIEQFSLL